MRLKLLPVIIFILLITQHVHSEKPAPPIFNSQEDILLITSSDGITVGNLKTALWYKNAFDNAWVVLEEAEKSDTELRSKLNNAADRIVTLEKRQNWLIPVSFAIGAFTTGIMFYLVR